MIYLDFFKLDRRPFAIQPDSSFLYWSDQHKKAFDALHDQILSDAQFTLLTGEIGAGKTLLINELMHAPEIDKRFNVCLIKNPQGDAVDTLKLLISTFGAPNNNGDLWQNVWMGAVRVRSGGMSPIVVVDEAQSLSNESAAVLGRLATGDEGRVPHVPVVLIGQPELKSKIDQSGFRLLKKALGFSMHLKPLSTKEVGKYINSRLHKAGAPADNGIFEPATFPLIHEATNGTPRLINKLCEVCLFLAGENKEKSISAKTLKNILTNFVDLETLSLTDGRSGSIEPSDVIVLQEPKRKDPPEPIEDVSGLKLQPLDTAKPPSVPKASPPPITQPRGKKKWLAGGAVAAIAYVLSPFGPLPQDNGLMVALYGGPPAPQTDGPPTLPATPEQSTPEPEVAVAPVEPDEPPTDPEPVAVVLPTLQRAYDPAAEPAQPYFEEAIASTDAQQIVIAYTRAAIRGHARSAQYLGQLFDTGDGVAFAPEVAARWYAVADDPALLDDDGLPEVLLENGQATPLFSTTKDGRAEFIWQGKAETFRLEIGDSDGKPIAQFTTPLTAALLSVPEFGVFWRLRTDPQNVPDWTPIVAAQAE